MTDRQDTIVKCTQCGRFALTDSELPPDEIDAFASELRAASLRHPHLSIGELLVTAIGISCPQLSLAANEKLIEEVRSL